MTITALPTTGAPPATGTSATAGATEQPATASPTAPATPGAGTTPGFADALASAAQHAGKVPELSPPGAPPSITLAAALGLAPAIPVFSGAAAAALGDGVAGATPVSAGTDAAAAAGGAPVGSGWKAKLPAAGRRWADAIETAATRHGIDPRLLAALVKAESGFRQEARSHAGAIGLAQLMPGTARGLGVDPYNPIENLEGGARFLKSMKDQFGSDELALAAYNAGPGRVQRAGGIPDIRETRNYVPKVMRFYNQLRS